MKETKDHIQGKEREEGIQEKENHELIQNIKIIEFNIEIKNLKQIQKKENIIKIK